MENRTQIGFYYVWNKSWMGGVTYACNLLKALNTLDDKDKPFVDVYCRNEEAFENLKTHTGYPYLSIVLINDNNILMRSYRKVVELFRGVNYSYSINMFKIRPDDQMFYPYGFGTEINKLVYWCADLQDKYLPDLFTNSEKKKRDNIIRFVANRGIPIVFSSYDSENAFKKFYPEYSNKTFVVHFAVGSSDYSHINIKEVKKKYCINGDYLFCANQFWKHKNHLFLFKAFKKALHQGLNLKLICTGRMSDYRNPEYIEEIKMYIKNNQLEKDILLLGLIDGDELHCLMKNSYAVVQPSLFEGWNTTVEDCKALSKFIYLSDLPVHQEQAKNNVCFFNPYDEDDLAEKLLKIKPTESPSDYSNCLREFGENFMEVVRYVESRKGFSDT